MKNRIVSGKLVGAIIATELLLIAVCSWVAAGFPGLRHEDGPPSITIRLGPGLHAPALARSYRT